MVVNIVFSNLDVFQSVFGNEVLFQNRVKSRIKFLVDTFKEHWFSEFNSELQRFQKDIGSFVDVEDFKFLFLSFFDPLDRLQLGVDT